MATSKDIEEIKASLSDMQSGMCWIYKIVGIGVNEKREVATDARHISNKLGFHESNIDDNTQDLHELIGKVDTINEEVQKLTNMTQCSHFQESLAARYF